MAEWLLHVLPKVTFQRIVIHIPRFITEKLGARNTPELEVTDRFKLLTPKHGI